MSSDEDSMDRVFDVEALAEEEHSLVAVHPSRPEALTLCRKSTLVRWSLTDTAELLEATETAHERIVALDISPDGSLIAVVPEDAPAELRGWTYPTVVAPVAAGHGASLATFQPGGDLLAIADDEERLLLWDLRRESIATAAFVPARTRALRFSPEGDQLAIARSSPDGAGVVLFDVDEGRGGDRRDQALADESTESSHRVESATSLAYSPDGGRLAVWQTTTSTSESRPRGWLGDVVALEPQAGRRLWKLSVDATTLEDLAEEPEPRRGAPARLCFCDGGRLIALGLPRLVVFLATSDGRPVATRRAPGSVCDLDVDRRRGDVVVVGAQGLWRIPVPRD